jgi:hypothetical protein
VDAGILMHSLEDLGIHSSNAVRSFSQPLTIRVFADRQQDLADRSANSVQVH